MAAQAKGIRPGQRVMAFVSVEGRSIRGVVLEALQQGVWVQLPNFPAPILFPFRCIEAA
jgi:hypothetical protein